jgi:hypothetical protein
MKKFFMHALILKTRPASILHPHEYAYGAYSTRPIDAGIAVNDYIHVKPKGAVKERDESGRLRVRDPERLSLRMRVFYICKLKSVDFLKWRVTPGSRKLSPWLHYLY